MEKIEDRIRKALIGKEVPYMLVVDDKGTKKTNMVAVRSERCLEILEQKLLKNL